MNINRSEIKRKANSLIVSTEPKALYVGTLYLVLSMIVTILSKELFSVNISESEAQRYFELLNSQDIEALQKLSERMLPPASSYPIYLLLQLVLVVISVGFTIFLMNTVRGTEPCYGNLLDGFGMFWRVILLSFLRGLVTIFFMMLFVVPGFIMVYAYSQSVYIMIDHPEWSVLQCMKASREMMRGHKNQLFLLDLSLIPYWLAVVLPQFFYSLSGIPPYLGYLVQIYTTPFFGLIKTLYYEDLRSAQQ